VGREYTKASCYSQLGFGWLELPATCTSWTCAPGSGRRWSRRGNPPRPGRRMRPQLWAVWLWSRSGTTFHDHRSSRTLWEGKGGKHTTPYLKRLCCKRGSVRSKIEERGNLQRSGDINRGRGDTPKTFRFSPKSIVWVERGGVSDAWGPWKHTLVAQSNIAPFIGRSLLWACPKNHYCVRNVLSKLFKW